MRGNNLILKVYHLAIFIVLVSCSPKVHKNFLTFFFDGVPVRDSIKTESSRIESEDKSKSDVFRPVPIEVNSSYTVHYPYKEKECYSCHDENSKSELLMSQPGLCYSCHENFVDKFKYVHGPVAGGYCTSCHNPHMSKIKKLLLRSGQDLCLNCHLPESVLKNDTHKDIADSECTVCHNPHGGEDRYILN
jgi:predicted CXXCH cytochrome family protein